MENINVYYVPPAGSPRNFAADFVSGYLEQRTPIAQAFISQKLRAMDPTARLNAIAKFQQMSAQRAATQDKRRKQIVDQWQAAKKQGASNLDALIGAVKSIEGSRISGQASIVSSEVSADQKAREAQVLEGASQRKVDEVIKSMQVDLQTAMDSSGGDPAELGTRALQAVARAKANLSGLALKPGETAAASRQLSALVRQNPSFNENAQTGALAQAILGGVKTQAPDAKHRGVGFSSGGKLLVSQLEKAFARQDQIDKTYSDQLAAFDKAADGQPDVRLGGEVQKPGETGVDFVNRLFDEYQAKLDAVGNPYFQPLFQRGRVVKRQPAPVEQAPEAAPVEQSPDGQTAVKPGKVENTQPDAASVPTLDEVNAKAVQRARRPALTTEKGQVFPDVPDEFAGPVRFLTGPTSTKYVSSYLESMDKRKAGDELRSFLTDRQAQVQRTGLSTATQEDMQAALNALGGFPDVPDQDVGPRPYDAETFVGPKPYSAETFVPNPSESVGYTPQELPPWKPAPVPPSQRTVNPASRVFSLGHEDPVPFKFDLDVLKRLGG